MDDDAISRIDALVEEEHRLRSGVSAEHPMTDAARHRLAELEVQLDQCWDLLRRRRARLAAGQTAEDQPPDKVRPAEVVEHYQQ
jgi:hypothetical protein